MKKLNAESPDEAWYRIKRVFGRGSGHWRLPLKGYGLGYFDRLVEEFASAWPTPLEQASEQEWRDVETRVALAETALAAAEQMVEKGQQVVDVATAAVSAATTGTPGEAAAKATLAAAGSNLVTAKAEALRQQEILKAGLKSAAEARFSIGRKLEAARRIRVLISRKQDLVWSDLLAFEAALGRLRTPVEIRTQLPLLRSEYRDLIGVTAYAALSLPAVNLNSQQIPEPELRAEFEALLAELHWHYLSAPQAESTRSRLLCGVLISLAVLVVAALWAGGVFTWAWPLKFRPVSPLALVAICGGLGATLSAVQRTQSVAVRGASLMNVRGAVLYWLSYSIAPWVGALCAMILAMMFAAAFLSATDGVISAKAFPDVRWARNPFPTNLVAGVTNIVPTKSVVTNVHISVNKVGDSKLLTNTVTITNYSTNVVLTNSFPASFDCDCNKTNKNKGGTADIEDGRCQKPGCEHWCFRTDRDYALLLLWALIAGFSERLVPDLLSRVSRKTEGLN